MDKKALFNLINGNTEKDVPELIPDSSTPIEIDPEAKLTFVVFGDPQVTSLSAVREMRFNAACTDIANMKSPLDAIVIVGDVSEYGKKDDYDTASRILNKASHNFKNFIAVSGNHDVRFKNYKKQLALFNSFISDVNNGVVGSNDHYYFSHEINGYKFIMLGTDKTKLESAYISKEQLSWLDKEITDGTKDGKPVFVFNHQSLKKEHGLPDVWNSADNWRGSVGAQSDKIKAIFEKYKNVIFITGHLHYGVYENSFEDHGAYKSISVPTVGPINHGPYSKDCQSYVFSVYEEKIVAKGRLFGDGKYVDPEQTNAEIEIKIN